VSSVRLHTGYKTHKTGVYDNLRCCATSSYGGCGAKLVGTIHKSIERPTTVDCLRELGRVIQRDHGPTCIAAAQELQTAEKDSTDVSTKRAADTDEGAASLNTTEVLMLHRRIKIIQQHPAEANKAVLEVEKERDELHNQIEQIKEQLHPKRPRTHDDAGDAHEMIAEVDNWDLRDHRQQVTRGKTAAMYKSGLARINKSLAQARTASCITLVLVWLGGFHIGVWGTLLWQSIYLWC